jgi:hypothetical protein
VRILPEQQRLRFDADELPLPDGRRNQQVIV